MPVRIGAATFWAGQTLSRLRQKAALRLASQERPLITRVRFQLFGGLLVCIALPALLRFGSFAEAISLTSANNASAGASLAFVAGYYLHRQLGSFPGVQSGTHILFSVFMPFATMAVLFLLLRLEYSRFIFLASFATSLAWLIAIHFVTRRTITQRVAIVPGGQADSLARLGGVEWHVLLEPPKDIGPISAVAVDLRHNLGANWQRFLVRCSLAGKPVYHSKHLTESLTGKVQIEHMSENNFGSLLPNLAYLKVKQIIDWLIALAALPFFLLISLVVVPLVVANSGWPALFVQERIGYQGRKFRVFKFRTMTASADQGDAGLSPREAAMTKERDSRITATGRFLRKYRIDELPQIINILRGEMSWIGPRPEALTLSKWYEEELAFYPYRHVVRPGISGWAQVNQGHVTSSDQVLEKLHYDFFYIKYLSPWLDLLIALRTLRTVLFAQGAK